MTKREKEIIMKELKTLKELTFHPMESQRALPIYQAMKSLAIRLGIQEKEIAMIKMI